LTPTAGPRARWVVLVVPPFGVSTREAFKWWDDGDCAHRSPKGFARHRVNELQAVVAQRHPEIAQIVTTLKKAGATEAAMSGSGSAVFGRVGREKTALDAATKMFAPGRRTIVTRTLDRAAYQRLAAR